MCCFRLYEQMFLNSTAHFHIIDTDCQRGSSYQSLGTLNKEYNKLTINSRILADSESQFTFTE